MLSIQQLDKIPRPTFVGPWRRVASEFVCEAQDGLPARVVVTDEGQVFLVDVDVPCRTKILAGFARSVEEHVYAEIPYGSLVEALRVAIAALVLTHTALQEVSGVRG